MRTWSSYGVHSWPAPAGIPLDGGADLACAAAWSSSSASLISISSSWIGSEGCVGARVSKTQTRATADSTHLFGDDDLGEVDDKVLVRVREPVLLTYGHVVGRWFRGCCCVSLRLDAMANPNLPVFSTLMLMR